MQQEERQKQRQEGGQCGEREQETAVRTVLNRESESGKEGIESAHAFSAFSQSAPCFAARIVLSDPRERVFSHIHHPHR